MKVKRCSRCKNIKKIEEFTSNKRSLSGFSYYCIECTKIKRRLWKEKHPNIIRKHRSSKEQQKEYDRRYKERHAERIKENSKLWRKNNKSRYREISKKTQMKIRSTLRGRLNDNIRSAIYKSLRGNKNGHWENLVGYNINKLRRHIENKFLSGMTWTNYGSIWHIDHIIPVSVFNFSSHNDIDFQRCWSLKNLRPLWAKDNLSKNNKLIKNFQSAFLF